MAENDCCECCGREIDGKTSCDHCYAEMMEIVDARLERGKQQLVIQHRMFPAEPKRSGKRR